MSKAQQLTVEATEGEDFDARKYFMGGLEPLSARGFEHREYDPVDDLDTWRLDVPPFWVWGTVTLKGIQVAVELVMQGERTRLNEWNYHPEDVDAAIAQVDRILPLVKNFAGVPGREDSCRKLRAMGPAPGVNEAEEADFNSSDGAGGYVERLNRMGFVHDESADAYIKAYAVYEPSKLKLVVALFYDDSNAIVDITLAAVDSAKDFRVIKQIKSIRADDAYTYLERVSRAASELKAEGGLTTSAQLSARCSRERLLESEQEFDPREYLLSNPVPGILKRLGYEKLDDNDAYSKCFYESGATKHYLTIYGVDFPGDPTAVIVEYQKHVPLIGYVFPWSARVEQHKMAALLPLLESAIKSAWDQEMTEAGTKAALDAIVK